MRRLTLYIFLFVFLANTMIASVWAMPCMMDKGLISQQLDVSEIAVNNSSDFPCHDMQDNKEQDESQGCEDLCLCLNVLVSQTPIIYSDNLIISALSTTHFSISNETIASINSAPLFRPPIILF